MLSSTKHRSQVSSVIIDIITASNTDKELNTPKNENQSDSDGDDDDENSTIRF